MALINCPNCNHADVSSTATSCPHCKYNIKKHFEKIKQEQEAKEKELQMKYVMCPECKNDRVPENALSCAKCGFGIAEHLREQKVQAQIEERQMQENRKKMEAIAENEARWNLVLIGLVVHLVCLLIGYAFQSAFGIGIILLASILFVIYMCSVDYPIYQDKWLFYGIGMVVITIFNGAVGCWLAVCVLVGGWRYKDGQRWLPKR